MTVFDDAWLDDSAALQGADEVLRRLAQAGGRLRQESGEAVGAIASMTGLGRPRAVVAAGPDARLIRAQLEPHCPVPFVAWPAPALPGWVGALDLVIVLASEGADETLVSTVHEAVRRGARLVVACPEVSTMAEHAGARDTILLPTRTTDTLAAAIVVLAGLHVMALGPEVDLAAVADALDRVAEDCSPFVDVSTNPAKELALSLAEAQPLVWGGSVLAARASRRLAESYRAATGRPALAADADELIPVLDAARPHDPFADPFADSGAADRRPCLVVLDDGTADDLVRAAQGRLVAAADRNDVRVCVLSHHRGTQLERYVTLLQTGLYGSVYLGLGLGRYAAGH